MRALIGKRSSEDKLKDRIRKTFIEGSDSKEVCIIWGNWGRNPNLKHQPPTPGIGLRRNIHKTFHTLTLDERLTSSRCPNCLSEVYHPKTKKETKNNIEVESDVHHLLRCTNAECKSRCWHRDVLAITNFRFQVDHILETGEASHPRFRKQVEPQRDNSGPGKQKKSELR